MTAAAQAPTKRGRRGPKWGLALPSFLWYAMFFLAPIAVIVVYSFGAKDSSKLVPVDLSSLSFDNYGNAHHNRASFFERFHRC